MAQQTGPQPHAGSSLQATRRPVVYSTQGVISSGHYLTSIAGMRMLLGGGNAFDGIVAAGFAAAVVEPIASYSLAAEGVFMLYHPASGDLLSLSGQGVAPSGATAQFYKSQGLERIPTGPGPQAPLAFTVPGVVDAFISLLERYGTKPVADVLAPAIHYAQHGIPNYEHMLGRLRSPSTRQQFDQFPPGGNDIFYHNGQVPRPGSLLVQPGLANTLQVMAQQGSPHPAIVWKVWNWLDRPFIRAASPEPLPNLLNGSAAISAWRTWPLTGPNSVSPPRPPLEDTRFWGTGRGLRVRC